MADTRLAFLGLGIMGQAMALNLQTTHPLVVYNRTPERAQPLVQAGAVGASTAAEAASRADVIFLMLKDDAAVEAVVQGPEGILATLRAGSVIVDHSTISPEATRRLAHAVERRGAHWCDAPVTGGDIGAREGTLTIMVGGRQSDFARVEPWLRIMGNRVLHVGPVGQGQTLKLVANLVSALNLMAASEGVRMGLSLGIPLEVMETVMTFGSAQSFELAKALERLRQENYAPGFSVDNRYKDLRLAVELARSHGFSADLAEAAEPLFLDHLRSGYGDLDEASYIKRWGDG